MLKQEGTCCEEEFGKKQADPVQNAGQNKVSRHLKKGENTMKRRDFMKLSALVSLQECLASLTI